MAKKLDDFFENKECVSIFKKELKDSHLMPDIKEWGASLNEEFNALLGANNG
jgi:hypothetical protein